MKNVTRIGKQILLGALAVCGISAASAQTVMVDQGAKWTDSHRQQFYVQDQGSRIMPLAWMQALKLPTGQSFLHDGLARFGYLPNPSGGIANIPVGFTVSTGDNPAIGMTCSACHTRQIEVKGTAYRIDGGPAIVEFQSFLEELDAAVAASLASQESFKSFSDAVLGSGATEEAIAALKVDVELWYLRYHTLMTRSLPTPAWGPSRLDAVSMIFNRLAGLDLGEPPSYIIADNIQTANAPTRYPFLWNAARQDRTQWPGFADNGNEILGLARNLGEVYGVFGVFHPKKQSGFLELNRDYISENSANFSGLRTLEDLIWKIGPPKWPWQLDQTLVAKGKEVFDRKPGSGGCVACHGIRKGAFRSIFHETWATPVQDVGTDTRECSILGRTVDTGVLAGAKIPLIGVDIKQTDTAFNALSASVLGAIVQKALGFRSAQSNTKSLTTGAKLPAEFDYLKGAFRDPSAANAEFRDASPSALKSGCGYESRVLEGIWAAAPYLHNGSVATLEDLLKPTAERASSFPIGPNYDLDSVGLAKAQTRFDYVLKTTDCSEIDSGNSRCGHEFGTSLPPSDKAALLEYLKSL